MADTFVIGVDFGTESGRALLVNTETGEEVAASSHKYAHGVMDQYLPDGTPLQENWALQHPSDYLEVLRVTVRNVLQQANVHPANVIGLGIDFTSCTMLPLTKQGEPLCLQSKYATRPHSWVKLWKHHAAHREAEYVTDVAKERGEGFLNRYGGKISSEWMIPKILQIINEDKDVYEQADLFMEAGDWLVYKMTGNLIRSSNTCGYKALWNKKEGYPDNDFFKALHPDMENIIETKLRGSIKSIGEKAGELTAEMAEFIGLEPRTAVAVNVIDAHAVLPAVGAVNPGQMVMAIGTSTCHMLISDKEKYVPGVCGMVEDGIIPGYVSYETGQVAVGDSFAWLVENSVPVHSYEEAKKKGMSIHAYLEEKAAQLTPGASGLIALDWWNGNRSVLVDANLTGALIGLKLSTTPEEIYRALIESTAFGTRKIIETFHNENVPVTEIFVCGGIPQKNKLLIQIYADVLNREIKVANSQEITAYGAAMYAATAAGANKGGFDSIFTAAKKMAKVKDESFYPIEENVQMYNELYEIYVGLHDFFGIDRSDLMHKLNQFCLQ